MLDPRIKKDKTVRTSMVLGCLVMAIAISLMLTANPILLIRIRVRKRDEMMPFSGLHKRPNLVGKSVPGLGETQASGRDVAGKLRRQHRFRSLTSRNKKSGGSHPHVGAPAGGQKE
jgi:hypothetical protein